ncbi:MAG: c-type cytochrome [Solirubrobacterales bacterium]
MKHLPGKSAKWGSLALITVAAVAAISTSGCGFGEQGVEVAKGSGEQDAAELFAANCGGCHTLSAAGVVGSGNDSSRVQGPNLDQRKETVGAVLYAIRNGGYSGAVMPQNILVGEEAKKVARFVARYAGSDVSGGR